MRGLLHFRIHLFDETLRLDRLHLRRLGIEVGRRLRSDHLIERLALVHQFCYAVTYRQDQVTLRYQCAAVDKPVLLLNRFNSCWRRMLNRSDSR